jgi:hypothetical protein
VAAQNPRPEEPRDAAHWARYVEKLEVSDAPEGALNLNVEGRTAVSPLQGFGKMWQKTYKLRLEGAAVTPAEVIKVWKQDFPKFWGARGNRFYAPLGGLKPGEVVLINGPVPGGARISTGIMVLYADDESFTFMTPEGHPFSGWVTFSSYEEGRSTVAQAQVLIRANDPLYEIGMPLGLHRVEDKTWQSTLENLAAHLGAKGKVETRVICVDPKRQWRHYKNIQHNAIIRSMLYAITIPLRRIKRSNKRLQATGLRHQPENLKPDARSLPKGGTS